MVAAGPRVLPPSYGGLQVIGAALLKYKQVFIVLHPADQWPRSLVSAVSEGAPSRNAYDGGPIVR